MEEKYQYNPYDFLNPVKDPELFAGRHDELREIRYYFDLSRSKKPKYFNLALIGPRSVGKTSLLNMIEHIANEKGLLAVKIPLNKEISQSDILFFKEIFDGIMTKGAERSMYDGIDGKIYRGFRKVIDALDIQAEVPLLFGTAYVGLRKNQHAAGMPQSILIHDLKELHEQAKKTRYSNDCLTF
ncbi:MAG: hypothetical protein QME68_06800 [Elusimicrobiota bacterium]|nr:hypothetical protein [Elusimicrobiota bacterium]